jgi:hypothetical protein
MKRLFVTKGGKTMHATRIIIFILIIMRLRDVHFLLFFFLLDKSEATKDTGNQC